MDEFITTLSIIIPIYNSGKFIIPLLERIEFTKKILSKSKINLIAEKPLKLLISRPMLRKVNIKLVWDDPIQAPIRKNQKVGKIIIEMPDKNITTNLVSSKSVDQLGPFSKLKSAFNFLLFGGNFY